MYFKILSMLKPITITSKTGKEFRIQKIIIMDKYDAEIELSLFEDKIDKFGLKLQQFKEYIITKGIIQANINCYGYLLSKMKIQVSSNTSIRKVNYIKKIPQLLKPTLIHQISEKQIGDYISVAGIATELDILENQLGKNGKTYNLLKFFLLDRTAAILIQVWGKDCENYYNINGKIIWIRYAKISTWNQSIYLNNKGYIITNANETNEELNDLKKWYVITGKSKKKENTTNLSLKVAVNWSNVAFISLSQAEKDLQTFGICQKKPTQELFRINAKFIGFSHPGKQQWYWGAKNLNYAGCSIRNNGKFWCKKGKCMLDAREVEERWAMKIIIADANMKNKIPVTIMGENGNDFIGITAKIAHQKTKERSWTKYVQEMENKSFYLGIKAQFKIFRNEQQMQYVVDYIDLGKTESDQQEKENDPASGWL